MIWVWMALSLAVTLFLLRGKNIKPHNLVWAFLPIDMYGITIAGVTLKPAMLYSIILIAYAIISKKFTLKITKAVLYTTVLLAISITISLFFRGNADIGIDITAYTLMFFTIVIAACVLSFIDSREDLKQISDVMIATAVGFGIILLALYILDHAGITLPAVRPEGSSSGSIIREYRNATNGELTRSYRMRGFNIDPNSSCMTFIVGLACLFGQWIKKGNAVKNLFFTFVILGYIVVTSSRSALIICIFIIIISVFRLFLSKAHSKRKVIFVGSVLFVLFLGAVFTVYDSKTFSYFYDNLISGYKNRTGLTDEYGRFELWSQWLSLLNNSNWFCGVGFASMTQLVESHRDAHNTIIQILCSSGVPVGILYAFFFVSPLFYAIKRRINDKKNAYYLTNFTLAYLGILSMLLTVFNLASLYMIYTALLLYIIPGCLEQEEHLIANKTI